MRNTNRQEVYAAAIAASYPTPPVHLTATQHCFHLRFFGEGVSQEEKQVVHRPVLFLEYPAQAQLQEGQLRSTVGAWLT